LVVIAIIAVLLAVLLPALASVKEKGKRMQCGFNLTSISKGISLYADDNDGKLLNIRKPGATVGTFGSIDEHPYMAYNIDYKKPGSTTQLLAMNLACLYDTGIVGDARTFYCPACTSVSWKWESYSDPMPWEKLPKTFVAMESGNNWVRTGYIYRPIAKKTNGYAEKIKDINPNRPWVTDTIWTLKNLNHVVGNVDTARGIYAAFPDGHVNWCSNSEMFSDEIWPPNDSELRPTSPQFLKLLSLMEP
jgi:hypothetical protein